LSKGEFGETIKQSGSQQGSGQDLLR